jgi:hypothetical protein
MDLILQASRITQNPTEFEIFLGDVTVLSSRPDPLERPDRQCSGTNLHEFRKAAISPCSLEKSHRVGVGRLAREISRRGLIEWN